MKRINGAKQLAKALEREGARVKWIQTATDSWEGEIIGTKYVVWTCDQAPVDKLFMMVSGQIYGPTVNITKCEVKKQPNTNIVIIANEGASVPIPIVN